MEKCHRSGGSEKTSPKSKIWRESKKRQAQKGEEGLLDRRSIPCRVLKAGKHMMSSEDSKTARVARTERTQCKLRLESQVRSEHAEHSGAF